MNIDVAALEADLRELVAFGSVGGSDAESEVQQWCADQLRELSLDVDHWQFDLGSLTQAYGYPGQEVFRSEAWGCVGTSRVDTAGDGTPALILNGHVDVVPPGELALWPDGNPYAVRTTNGSWFGRGTCDMKAGVAAVLAAVRATKGAKLARPFAVHTVIGEEDGGLGTFGTLQRGHTGDVCLIAEPTDGQIVSANAGSLTFRLEIAGAATHGSTRTAGVSAIEKFALIHDHLRSFESERNTSLPAEFAHLDLGWPLSIGTINAGDWASTVPDMLTAEGRYGVKPGETLNGAKRAFSRAIAEVSRTDPWLSEHPVRVTWPGGHFAPGRLPLGHELLGQVQDAAEKAGAERPGPLGGPYGSDLRLYAQVGIPTLQYGPGHTHFAHAVDEQVSIDEVVTCAQTYAELILTRCGA